MMGITMGFERRATSLAMGLFLVAASLWGDPAVLRWSPTATNRWDATAVAWLDESNNAVAWQPGATAQFDGGGGLVDVDADLSVSNLVFSANGYALLGAGRLSVAGAISVAAGATNSVAVELCPSAGSTKTGAGTLAVSRCLTPLAVAEGTLLVSGRDTADAELAVASGASLHVLGGPATAANVVANASFEAPALAAGGYAYASATAISNWTTATGGLIARQNTAANTPWNSAGAAPDASHALIVQYGGSVAQTVTVASDGLYALSFFHFLRLNYPETPVKVYLGGVRLACFVNSAVQFAHQLYVSPPLFLKAGAYELRFEGDAGQSDRSSMIDLVCLAPPGPAMAGSALAGLSTLRVASGATVRMDFSGTAPLARVYIDGALQAAGTFTSSHASGGFAGSGAFSSAAPENIFAWTAAAGNWSGGANWESSAAPSGGQNLALLFPLGAAGAYTNDLGSPFALNSLWAAGAGTNQSARIGGNGLLFTNTAAGVKPSLKLSGSGAAELAAPLSAFADLSLDSADDLTVSGTLSFPLTNSYVVSKAGPGAATLASVSGSPGCYTVYEGTLTFGGVHTGSRPLSLAGPFAGIPAAVVINSLPGRTSAFYVTQAGAPIAQQVFFSGLGESVFGTRCGGGTVSCGTWFTGFGAAAVYDVGAGDTLRIQQLVEAVNDAAVKCLAGVVKAGPGTVEVRSLGLNNTNRRAYTGPTVVRNGTLTLSVDDCGTLSGYTNPFNGQTYDGRGGSLGYTLFTNAVRLGDSRTAATDTLALNANGDKRYIGHDMEILNVGAGTTLGMTTGTVLYAGDLLLHKSFTLKGPATGHMILDGDITAAPDFAGSGALALDGLAALTFNGALSSGLSLAAGGRSLRFGQNSVKITTLSAFALGGTSEAPALLDVDFNAGANDRVDVSGTDGLTLGAININLLYANLGTAFSEPGTYTLFTYAGTLNGDVTGLAVTNLPPGIVYAFSNDTANTRVVLTLAATGGSDAVWAYPGSGVWSLGSNWSGGTAPGGADVAVLFGSAIPSPSTVTLDGGRTAGALVFNNTAAYTLSGDALTLNTTAGQPSISSAQGSHTLNLGISASADISVSTANGSSLTLSNATVNAPLTLEAGALLNMAQTNALLDGLSGSATALLSLLGAAPKLSVAGSGAGTFSGTLASSSTNARLEKAGSGTLTLAGGLPGFQGATTVSGGALGVSAAGLPGPVSLASGALSIASPATNGLMGYYYNRASINTNHFLSLAAFKAHLDTMTPDLAALSGLASNIFDFGGAADSKFPLPYGLGGSRTTNFEAAWLGKIRIPVAGRYRFRLYGDDGLVLAVDNVQLAARSYYAARWEEGDIDLDTGLHDILVGYYQATGAYGLKLEYTMANNPHYSSPLSNSWLVAESRVGTLSGSGPVSLPGEDSAVNARESAVPEYFPAKTLTGALSGHAASAFSKSGTNLLTVTDAAAFNGQFRVSEGVAAVSNSLGSAALAAVNANAVMKFTGAAGTVGGLSGQGLVSPNGAYAYAFSGDASSGIATTKTYTHKLDFPADGAPATVNGVVFTAAGTSGSADGYAWSIANPPPSTYPGSGTGMAGLTADFYYASRDFTVNLAGLAPGQPYEFRLYFKSWYTVTRLITYTFSAGASPVDTLTHVVCSLSPYSIVGFRYTADAAGTVSVRVQSHHPGDGYHLYGLTNEESDAPVTAALTVDAAAGSDWTLSGALGGSGSLVKSGAGSQTFGGTVTPLVKVQAGTLAIGPGAVLAGGAEILAGGTLAADQGGGRITGLSGEGALRLAAGDACYIKHFNTDGTCEISTSKTYTHKLDFGTGAAGPVNGVTFTKTSSSSGTANGYGWSGFPTSSHAGNDSTEVSATNTVHTLLRDMNYGIMNNGTMYLTGLIPGRRYEVRFYNRSWGTGNSNRGQVLTFDPDGAGPKSESFQFNPDIYDSQANFVAYRYTAEASSLKIFLQAVVTNNMSLHLYGLTNEELPGDAPLQVETFAGTESVFSGVASGYGAWAKTGAGTLTLAGMNNVSGALAVAAGTLVVDGGATGAGAVTVAAGATVCGSGSLGGPVTVASNAVIHAGTPAACGTLAVGGSLTLEPGALPAFRFGAGALHDTINVAGVLTFPTNGVVQAAALPAGTRTPPKALFLSSSLPISGPADLTGWTVAGVENTTLKYSDDHTKIYVFSPSGTLIAIR